MSLVVSGGHTSIFFVDNIMNIKVINETTDDALGECYDKIARELGLGYPGGPMRDKMYYENCATISFINKDSYNDEPFSFSGLKTAVLNYINSKRMKNEQIDTVSIVSSFQKQAGKGCPRPDIPWEFPHPRCPHRRGCFSPAECHGGRRTALVQLPDLRGAPSPHRCRSFHTFPQ